MDAGVNAGTTAGTTADWEGALELLGACAAALADLGEQGWLVGGCLRDALLGRRLRDLDVVVSGDPLTLARRLAPLGARGLGVAPLAAGHGTVRVTCAGLCGKAAWQLDLSALRGHAIEADLAARDFTVNALALPLAAHDALAACARAVAPWDTLPLLDPFGGLGDLSARRLRVVGAAALADDPLRVLRGARLAAMLDLRLDPTTARLARAACGALGAVARERIGEELMAIFALATTALTVRGVKHLRTLGALAELLPELCAPESTPSGIPATHPLDHALATLAALDMAQRAILSQLPAQVRARASAHLATWLAQPMAAGRPRSVALRWSALLHELGTGVHPSASENADAVGTVGEARVKTRAAVALTARMGLVRRERALVERVAACQPAALAQVEAGPADRARGTLDAAGLKRARRWFARTGDAGVETLIVAAACAHARTHRVSDVAGRAGAHALARGAADLLGHFLLNREQVVPAPLLGGRQLIQELGIAPGPALGHLLAQVRTAQLDGSVTTPAQALRLARALRAQPTP